MKMGFRKWWKKKRLWVKGGFFGLILGFVIYLLTFNSSAQTVWYNKIIGYLGYYSICLIFNAEVGEDCGWGFILIGWVVLPIFYGIIGFLIGLIINKIREQ